MQALSRQWLSWILASAKKNEHPWFLSKCHSPSFFISPPCCPLLFSFTKTPVKWKLCFSSHLMLMGLKKECTAAQSSSNCAQRSFLPHFHHLQLAQLPLYLCSGSCSSRAFTQPVFQNFHTVCKIVVNFLFPAGKGLSHCGHLSVTSEATRDAQSKTRVAC